MTNTAQLPMVSVLMPIRNEARYIARSLGSVLAQEYPPGRLEILVLDGMSDDQTRTVVADLAAAHRQIQPAGPVVTLLDNPRKIVAAGLNSGLARASGDIIVRVDGHCEIPPDYVRRCVELLADAPELACAGGSLETIGESRVARAIALAQSSPFGVGGASFRLGSPRAGYVDTLAFGAYRRTIFGSVGLFDEELVRNQDDEFNFRLTQSGARIWLDPTLCTRYYSRSGLRGLWRQYFQYGFYKVRVMQKRGAVAAWRHLVPAAFVLALLCSLLAALLTRRPWLSFGVAGPYLLGNSIASIHTARRAPQALPVLPAAFATLHLAYGLGFLYGICYWPWGRRLRQASSGPPIE